MTTKEREQLRDKIALEMLKAMMNRIMDTGKYPGDPELLTHHAYLLADSMLVARTQDYTEEVIEALRAEARR